MPEKRRRERGSNLKPEQRDYIDRKLREEKLSIKAAAAKYQIAEGSLRNALIGKGQDYNTLEDIIGKLSVPDVSLLKAQHRSRFSVPRERNPYFIGREAKLQALRQALEESPFAAVTQALIGLGGIGKTALAVEYAYRCLDLSRFNDYPRYKTIQFARADTAEVLKLRYAEIADALHLPRKNPNNLEEAVQTVIQWMMRPEEAPWLLVLDNVDDPNIIADFLPREPLNHGGHVVITSRSFRFAARIKRIELEVMEEEEGIAFLFLRTGRERLSGSKEEQAARSLSAEMGGLPLALEQAGAYMTHGVEMSFEDYLTNFRDQMARSEQMMHAPEYGFYRQFEPKTREYIEALTVLTTWQMSLTEIERHSPEAVQLLYFCAFLHPVAIPRELVCALLPAYFASAGDNTAKNNQAYNSLLNALGDYSLIKRDLNNDTHSMHVMVQAVLRDGLPPEDQQRIQKRILKALANSFPEQDYVLDGRGAFYHPHTERILTYVKQTGTEDEFVGLLLEKVGFFLYSRGRLAASEPYYQQALAIRRKLLCEDHPDIAVSLTNLAAPYHSQGRFTEAEPLYRQALAIRQKALPKDHPYIAESLNNLATLHHSQNQLAEAEPLYLQALAIWHKTMPEGDSEIAVSLNNLAALYADRRRFVEAELLHLQALAMQRKSLPEGHPEIAQTLNNLADLYRSQSRWSEAEPLFQQALVIRQQALPNDHPDTAISLRNLAALYRDRGRITEAEPLVRQALAIQEHVLPEDHTEIARSLNDLGILCYRQDRFAEAEHLHLRSLEIWRKVLPEDHPNIARGCNNLAQVYRMQGRFAEAELLFRQAVTIWKKAFPRNHPELALGVNNLAELFRKQERFAEADALIAKTDASIS